MTNNTPNVYSNKENPSYSNQLAYGNPLYLELNKDATVYWRTTISNAAAVDADPDELMVTELPDIKGAGTYNDIPIVRYGKSDAYGVVKFTATEAGEHTFGISDSSSTNMSIQVYSNKNLTGANLASGSSSSPATCTLEADQTIYLRISRVSTTAEGLTLTVTSPSSTPDPTEPENPGEGDVTP